MVVKVTTYFDVPGKFTVEEGNEIVRDLRSIINKYLAQSPAKSFSSTLSTSGKKVQVNILSEEEAKRRVVGTMKATISPAPNQDSDRAKMWKKYGLEPPKDK